MSTRRVRRRSAATPVTGEAAAGALAGVQVLDFTIVMSGPMCTRMLADAGADVVKVEPPEGDVARQRGPLRGGISAYYGSLNCGKRSLVLDLSQAEGRRIARELAARCDVLVENFRPGVMQRLGLDYAALAAINPRLVYASISGYGQTGPRAALPAYAPVIHAASGCDLANAEYQRDSSRPPNNGIFIADVLGASYAFGAIQLALLERERSATLRSRRRRGRRRARWSSRRRRLGQGGAPSCRAPRPSRPACAREIAGTRPDRRALRGLRPPSR